MDPETIQIDPDGHVNDHEKIWTKRSNVLGIPYKITVNHGDVIDAEEVLEPDPKYHEIEELLADATVYGVDKQWAKVAETSGAILIAGAQIEEPATAQAVITGVELVQAIGAKDWTKAESLLGSLAGEIVKAVPEMEASIAVLTALK